MTCDLSPRSLLGLFHRIIRSDLTHQDIDQQWFLLRQGWAGNKTMCTATVTALVKVLFSAGPDGKTATKNKGFLKGEVLLKRAQGQFKRTSRDVPQVASLTWWTLVKSPPSAPQFLRPSPLSFPGQDGHLSSLRFPVPFPAPSRPLLSSRSPPGPARSQVPSRVHHTPPARRDRPSPAGRPRPSILTPHPPRPRSRRRLRPQRRPHRPAPHSAPPRNTPPARGPLPHMMPEARPVREASG